jgi:hypothetical protein
MTEEEKLFLQQLQGVDPVADISAGQDLRGKLTKFKDERERKANYETAIKRAESRMSPSASAEERAMAQYEELLKMGLAPEARGAQEMGQSSGHYRVDQQTKALAHKLNMMEHGAKLGDAIKKAAEAKRPPSPEALQEFIQVAAEAGYDFDDPANPRLDEIDDFITGARGAAKDELLSITKYMQDGKEKTAKVFKSGEVKEFASSTPESVINESIRAGAADKWAKTRANWRENQKRDFSKPEFKAKVTSNEIRVATMKYNFTGGDQEVIQQIANMADNLVAASQQQNPTDETRWLTSEQALKIIKDDLKAGYKDPAQSAIDALNPFRQPREEYVTAPGASGHGRRSLADYEQ